MANDRYSEFIEIVGMRGRGKTTIMHNMLSDMVKGGDRVLVIVPDQQEPIWYDYYPVLQSDNLESHFNPNFKGFYVIEYSNKITFPFLLKQFEIGALKNLNIVLDDPNYARTHPEEDLIKILSRQRQYCIDLWSNAHSYDNIPPPFFQYITTFGVMKTLGEIKNRLDEVPNHVPHKREVDALAGDDRNSPNFHYIRWLDKDGVEIK